SSGSTVTALCGSDDGGRPAHWSPLGPPRLSYVLASDSHNGRYRFFCETARLVLVPLGLLCNFGTYGRDTSRSADCVPNTGGHTTRLNVRLDLQRLRVGPR